MGGKPRLSAADIERLRQSGLRIDRQGQIWHRGARVTHPRLRRALLRWLDRMPDGQRIIRLDDVRYAYVDVEDSDLLVVSARWVGDRVFVLLNDDSEEELDYDSLVIGAGSALYCRVRGGRLNARVTTQAFFAITERLVRDGPSFALAARGTQFPIPDRGARPARLLE